MICRPPKYNTAAWPRLAIKKITGNKKEKVRPTFSCCSSTASADRAKRASSCGSRTNARTTFKPATFSCTTVFSALRRIWTAMNSGCAIAPKAKNTANAIGKIGRITSVSPGLENHSTSSVAMSKMNDCRAMTRPWPMNMRTFSTSSVARIINWPVWLRSR